MKYIDEWRTALLLGFFHNAFLFFPLSRRQLEEFIAGVNMAVYEWHTHPHFRFLLIYSPFCWADRKIWSEDLIRDTEIWVTYVPPLQRFFLTAYLSSLFHHVSLFFPGRKHQSKNEWDMDTWVHTPFQSFFLGLPSRRLSLFPPLLSGRVEELIAGVDWDYRYRCLQVFFLTAHLFPSPSVSLIRIIDHRSWLTDGYLRNGPSSCNILFCCMPLFLPSTAPIWTIDHWS